MALTAFNVREEHGEQHKAPTTLSDFILGAQDGLVNVLGIILGVSAATSDIRVLLAATLAALGAESISMGAVAYTSTNARRKHYLKEIETEKREMKEVPHIERREVEDVFREWGYKGRELKRATDIIVSNPRAWLEFMMSHELHLSPIGKSAPFRSFVIVTLSTIFGSMVPIIPFLVLHGNIHAGVIGAVVVSGAVLFIIGYYEAKVTIGSLWMSGLRMAAIGLIAGFAGYLIGHFIGGMPPT